MTSSSATPQPGATGVSAPQAAQSLTPPEGTAYASRGPGDLFGRTIPMARSLGFVAEAISDGYVRIRLPHDPAFTNSRGDLHGGALMTLLDCALAGAARSHDPVHTSVMTVDVSTHFLAGAGGDVWGIGRVLRRGRSLVFAHADIVDAKGALIATATGSLKLIRRDVD